MMNGVEVHKVSAFIEDIKFTKATYLTGSNEVSLTIIIDRGKKYSILYYILKLILWECLNIEHFQVLIHLM
jgi:hypothetical protein